MSLPSLYIGRGRSWIVALFFLLLGGLVVGFLPEAERDASPTDSLAQGYDSTRVVELAERFPQEGDGTALILWTSTDGEALTEEQLAAARESLFERLPDDAFAGAGGPPPGVDTGAAGPPAGVDTGAAGPPAGVDAGAAGPPAGIPPLPLVSEDGTAAFGTIAIDAADAEVVLQDAQANFTLDADILAEARAETTLDCTHIGAFKVMMAVAHRAVAGDIGNLSAGDGGGESGDSGGAGRGDDESLHCYWYSVLKLGHPSRIGRSSPNAAAKGRFAGKAETIPRCVIRATSAADAGAGRAISVAKLPPGRIPGPEEQLSETAFCIKP